MNIKKKLQIIDILFDTLEGDELTEEHIDQALTSLVSNPVKRARYKEIMVKRYGPDVFKDRASKAGKSRKPTQSITE